MPTSPLAPNPYAAPAAQPAGASVTDKRHRANMINRRTVAVLLEGLVWGVTLEPLIKRIFLRTLHEPRVGVLVGWVVSMVAFFAARDLLGPQSPGKTLVGLRLVQDDDSDRPVRAAQRVVRNLVFVIPVMEIVEFFVAYYGGPAMQRLGDRMARTRVVAAHPERTASGTFSWQLLGTVVLTLVSMRVFEPAAARLWAAIL